MRVIIIVNPLNGHTYGGRNIPTQNVVSRDIVTNALAHIATSCIQPSVFVVFVTSSLPRRILGVCCAGAVPSPSNRHCTRTFRLAIAKNITFSTCKPGVVVALVFRPNSSLMDSVAVTWLSPGSSQAAHLSWLEKPMPTRSVWKMASAS